MKKGITEVTIGKIVLRHGKAHPRDVTAVDEIIYIAPNGARYCVDRGQEQVTEIWDVIRDESKRALRRKRVRG